MKKYLLYSMLAVSAIWQVFAGDSGAKAGWGAATNNLQMSITLEDNKTEMKAGQTYTLLIRYKNITTNQTFAIYEVNGTTDDPDYSFIIASPSGRNIAPDMAKVKRPFSGTFRQVAPGQIITIKFNLSKFCNLNETGTYKITAKREQILFVSENRTFSVVSNQLNITVVPNQ